MSKWKCMSFISYIFNKGQIKFNNFNNRSFFFGEIKFYGKFIFFMSDQDTMNIKILLKMMGGLKG